MSARGVRAKTRHKFRTHGIKPTVNQLLQDFNEGQSVVIKVNGGVHAGLPGRRFHGKTGVVVGKQGKACVVEDKDGHMLKTVIAHPVHLKAAG